MNKFYTGIGARDCPTEILDRITKICKWLALKDYTLRSGGANGCDSAAEKGCDLANGEKEIYLPWKEFNGSHSNLVVKDKRAFEIAAKYHPNYNNLSQGAKSLQARNSHQILGQNLDIPSQFVICYTKNGLDVGGTSQALRIARDYNIPIFNLGKYTDISECRKAFLGFYQGIK